MQWNIAAECISVVFILIILRYSYKSNLVPSLKNRMFKACSLLTLCSMCFNIGSTLLIAYPEFLPVFFANLITTIYFAVTPLMGAAYCCYTVASVYQDHRPLRIMAYLLPPAALYLLLVALNPFTDSLFYMTRAGAYVQGPLIISTYLVFYFYCLAALVVVVVRRRHVEPTIGRILMTFPAIALLVVVFQQFYPKVILSGSAATSALFIIYLYLQNKQNSTDYLTGLPNRQEFLKMLDYQIKKGRTFYITVVSLRGFRRINDTYGQHRGDLLLQEVASYLGEVADTHCLYRYGGDEFALISAELNEQKRILEEVRLRLQQSWRSGDMTCRIPAALGVVSYPESADMVEELVNGIEYAVARAKELSGVYYCGKEMVEAVRRRAQVVAVLESCLKNDSFTVLYQPIFSVAQGRYTVAEALLRVANSPIGPLYPDEFIPVAEATGLIVEMTYQVLDKVCHFVNGLEQAGVDFDGVQINFSGRQFSQMDLEERVTEIIEKNHTPFSKIKIEITESILAENTQMVAAFAHKMQKRGVLVELDDFGTGYSNIVTVMNTPLDIIKLDKGLIWSTSARQSALLLGSLTDIFHEMGMQVLAEGVETQQQDRVVRDCGIDLIQGFLYAKPMPEDKAAAFIRQENMRFLSEKEV